MGRHGMCLYRNSVILGEEQIVQEEPLRLWAKEPKGKPMANPKGWRPPASGSPMAHPTEGGRLAASTPTLECVDVANVLWSEDIEGTPIPQERLRGPSTGGSDDIWGSTGN